METDVADTGGACGGGKAKDGHTGTYVVLVAHTIVCQPALGEVTSSKSKCWGYSSLCACTLSYKEMPIATASAIVSLLFIRFVILSSSYHFSELAFSTNPSIITVGAPLLSKAPNLYCRGWHWGSQ